MIRIRDIKVSITDNNIEDKIKKILKVSRINNYIIRRKSIDARNKSNILYVYDIDVSLDNELKYINGSNIIESPNLNYIEPIMGKELLKERIYVIGSGPSGLFLSYMLATRGYKVTTIERGEDIDNRIKSVEEFHKNNKLNINSNIQYGEGGAGTFSDGKLNTLNKDSNNIQRKVMEIFIKHGAPDEILYDFHPHIGTDYLRVIIKNIRNYLISLGVEFRFNTTLTNIIVNNNKLEGIELNNSEIINTNNLVLAIGHSAKDTINMLIDKGLNIETKSFAVGLRIQHNEDFINKSMYGDYYKLLPPASYKLTYKSSNNLGVYSFCMCPGGYVVNSSSEEGHLLINGMSNYKRDSGISNSAIIVTVNKNRFNSIKEAYNFISNLEEKTYNLGEGKIPSSMVEDYLEGNEPTSIDEDLIRFKGNYKVANLNDLFPTDINDALKEGINYFSKIIKDFNKNAVVSAIESRTSSLVRIVRDENMESNIKGIYPIGEGSGYAGGITTSAVDGILLSEKLISKYHS